MSVSSLRWDQHFLGLAVSHSRMSKDPSTKVGAVIVGQDRELISAGFNGFPRGIVDSESRLMDRDLKLKIVVHAEMNAVLAAASNGIRLKGSTLYLVATKESTGEIWGGGPCVRCAVELIQAGIREIVSHSMKSVPDNWRDDLRLSRELLCEAGINYRGVDA